jgi:hypothetical protein
VGDEDKRKIFAPAGNLSQAGQKFFFSTLTVEDEDTEVVRNVINM